jgi:hypothetical protein
MSDELFIETRSLLVVATTQNSQMVKTASQVLKSDSADPPDDAFF